MPNLDLRVLYNKVRKDNILDIKLSIAHNGDTRYINTGVTISSKGQFKNGMVVKRPDALFKNTQLRLFVSRVEEYISKIEYINALSASEIVQMILHKDQIPTDIRGLFNEYISTARLAEKSICLAKCCYTSISVFLGDDYDIKKLGYAKIMALEKYLRSIGNSDSTIRTKMALLSKLVVYARRCKYVPFDFRPFEEYVYPEAGIRDVWLTTEQVKKLRDLDIDASMESVTRDLIMLEIPNKLTPMKLFKLTPVLSCVC